MEKVTDEMRKQVKEDLLKRGFNAELLKTKINFDDFVLACLRNKSDIDEWGMNPGFGNFYRDMNFVTYMTTN